MANSTAEAEVIEFPKEAGKKASSTERIWGKAVYKHGYAGIPSILIQAQQRLGINSMQMNIIVQLLDYWFEPSRKPFPTKKELATRIGVTEKTIQNNIRALELAGLIQRQMRRTAAGDWNSNIYDLDGLIAKVQALEPEFAAEKKQRKEAKAALTTPVGRRQQAKKLPRPHA
jgi:predicted transcriptional regulator